MKFIVGLGNPGNQYQDTRHNVGFRFLDLLAHREGVSFQMLPRFKAEIATLTHEIHGKIFLIKPQTFMNNSGESISPILQFYQATPSDAVVIFDDLDLPVGKVRLRKGGGHGGHNGLRSLNQHLPNSDYGRIKIGIGRPDHGNITAWVLGKASEGDIATERHIFDCIIAEFPNILQANYDKAGNNIHHILNQGS
ncbi:MAG: aminoacyl-tRNA hydrolase [Zetaproteobacteria bacterium]|nr:aminoacyl-tRNA hydrolase [Zetaproteobacteria bacterium]